MAGSNYEYPDISWRTGKYFDRAVYLRQPSSEVPASQNTESTDKIHNPHKKEVLKAAFTAAGYGAIAIWGFVDNNPANVVIGSAGGGACIALGVAEFDEMRAYDQMNTLSGQQGPDSIE